MQGKTMTRRKKRGAHIETQPHFTLKDIEDVAPEARARKIISDAPPGAVIKVVGVGGGGGNAINRMIAAGVEGVEFIAVNTDHQALEQSRATTRLQIGRERTRGLGSGARPEVGREAALEDTERLIEVLEGADMVFITTGLGGGTGTGAGPVIASLAADLDALVVAVVTKPFNFEGRPRRMIAEEGLKQLRDAVDTVITIPNDKLLSTVERGTSIDQAFVMADEVLRGAVSGISDLILLPGIINLDFADVRTVMKGAGMALMGTGVSEGENRAVEAAQQAISSPLLEDASIEGAHGVIINITGGEDFGLLEMGDAASIIEEAADPNAMILVGYRTTPEMNGRVKVTVVATGFKGNAHAERAVALGAGRHAAETQSPLRPFERPESAPGETANEFIEDTSPIIPQQPATQLGDLAHLDESLHQAHLNRSGPPNLAIPAFLRDAQD